MWFLPVITVKFTKKTKKSPVNDGVEERLVSVEQATRVSFSGSKNYVKLYLSTLVGIAHNSTLSLAYNDVKLYQYIVVSFVWAMY